MSVDLHTRYLGLDLQSPIVASAAPHNGESDTARRLERAGVGAIGGGRDQLAERWRTGRAAPAV